VIVIVIVIDSHGRNVECRMPNVERHAEWQNLRLMP
jgi:hypothetical protein